MLILELGAEFKQHSPYSVFVKFLQKHYSASLWFWCRLHRSSHIKTVSLYQATAA